MSFDAAKIPLSLSYYTVPELMPVETVHAAANAGFSFIGLRLLHGQPGGGEAPLMQDAALRRETMNALEARGLRALDASGARLVPGTDVDAFEPFLDVVAAMGARHVLATADDPDSGRVVDRLQRLCEKAASRGLSIDIEFVPWMAVSDVAGAARLADVVERANFGIAVDALHFHRSASTPPQLSAVPRERLRYVQLCDATATRPDGRDGLIREATKQRLAPGDGAIDLVGMLRAMPRGIPVALEVPMESRAQTVPARERLKQLVAATRAILERAYG
jgi:sugar phosphate isomerase/epimerase